MRWHWQNVGATHDTSAKLNKGLQDAFLHLRQAQHATGGLGAAGGVTGEGTGKRRGGNARTAAAADRGLVDLTEGGGEKKSGCC